MSIVRIKANAQIHIIWAILFLIIPHFLLAASPESGSIHLLEDDVIQHSHFNTERNMLWYSTRTEVGYFVGNKKHVVKALTNFSDLILDMKPMGDKVLVAGLGGVASYDLITNEIKTLKQLDLYGEKANITYALNLNIYEDEITFLVGNKYVQVDSDLSNPKVIDIPVNGFSSEDFYAMNEEDYLKNSTERLRASLRLKDYTYVINVDGEVIRFQNDGGSGEVIIKPDDLGINKPLYAYNIYNLPSYNRILITTSEGLIHYNYDSGTYGVVRNTENVKIYKKIKYLNDHTFYFTGKNLYKYDPKENVATIRNLPVYAKDVLNIINANGITYYATEFDGLIATTPDSPIVYSENSSYTQYYYTIHTNEGKHIRLSRELIKVDDKSIIFPSDTKKIWGHIELETKVFLFNMDSIYSLDKDSLALQKETTLAGKVIYELSRFNQNTLFITFKDSPSKLYDLTTKELGPVPENVMSNVWLNTRRVKLVQLEKKSIVYRNSSDIYIFNNKNTEAAKFELNTLNPILRNVFEFEDHYSFVYEKYGLIVDKNTGDIQDRVLTLPNLMCFTSTKEYEIEVSSDGDLLIHNKSLGSTNHYNLLELTYGHSHGLTLYNTCKINSESQLILSTSKGTIVVDLYKAYSFKHPNPKPILLEKQENSRVAESQSNYIAKYISSSPFYTKNLILEAKLNNQALYTVYPSNGYYDVSVNSIPFGESIITLQFRNNLNGNTYEPVSISLTKKKPFYLTWWFIVIYILSAIFLLFIISLIIKRYLKKKSLIDLARSKEIALNAYAHDAKTPVTSIVYTNAMVSKGLISKEQGYDRIYNSSRIIEHVADNMLSINEINRTGTLTINPSPYNYGLLINMIEDCTNVFAQNKKLNVSFEVIGDLELVITCDIPRIMQAYINVITNAIKYSPKGSKINVSVSLIDGESLIISVKDFGRGIPDDELEKILTLNYQATNRIKQGMGMGLYLVNNILKAYDGQLAIESNLNRGTRVKLQFPVTIADTLSTDANEPKTISNFTFMLLEDDTLLRKALSSLFESKGVKVYSFEDPESFFNSEHYEEADVYITDHFIGLDDYTGIDVAKRIIKEQKKANVVALTDQVDGVVKEQYEKIGCLYLAKTSSSFNEIYISIAETFDE